MEKKVKALLKSITNIQNNFGWRLWRVGAYIKNDEVNLFVAYHGQGLDENVYNEDYDKIVEFADVYTDDEYSLDEKVSVIVDRITDMEAKNKYYIDYGTGAGNEWVEGTLEDAQKTAAEGVNYTQTDAVILEDDEEVARLAWCGFPPDDDDIEVVADFGDFGYYYWA